jgi:hypothetical protein
VLVLLVSATANAAIMMEVKRQSDNVAVLKVVGTVDAITGSFRTPRRRGGLPACT